MNRESTAGASAKTHTHNHNRTLNPDLKSAFADEAEIMITSQSKIMIVSMGTDPKERA